MRAFRTMCTVTIVMVGSAGLMSCGGSERAAEPASATGVAGRSLPAVDQPATAFPVLAQQLEQPAIWPAADVVFMTPEEAAADFVREVLGVEPLLGEFQQGDTLSGEIVVNSPLDDDDPATVAPRGILILRLLEPTDGWYVIAAASDGVMITSPDVLGVVEAGPITVQGEARGFESTLNVSAFGPGESTAFDSAIGAGGAAAALEPYSVTLDVSGAAPGQVVVLLVVGDTGLSDDPGEFAAIPVVIDDMLPATR